MWVTYVISLNRGVQIPGTVIVVTKFYLATEFYTVGAKYLWVPSVESASCHLSGACCVKWLLGFFENWCIHVLRNLNADRWSRIESVSLNQCVILKALMDSATDIEGVF
jgi:hypothetical protein